jgi:IMP dehydrogenase
MEEFAHRRYLKAIAAGADCVMLGSLLAGTKESPGETIILKEENLSLIAEWDLSKQRWFKRPLFQDVEDDVKKLVPEGIVGRVPYKGELNSMLQFIGSCRNGVLRF